jgi:3-(3-hydroxy-phenyl)propionate hydroxylase
VLEDYEGKVFSYRRSADQDQAHIVRHKVAVVGAGPVGLALAIDLAQHGIECVLLDDQTTLSNGSRAICFAKRTLEIFDRLKAGEGITNAGVGWSVGKVFFGKDLLYQFDLAAEGGQHRPPFINLQQYVVEGMLLERAEQLPLLEVRFGHRLAGLEQRDQSGARLTLATPDGEYQIDADYVVACDGARSTARSLLDIATDGQIFKDRFLIADVRMRAPFPAERWFWFDPPAAPPARGSLAHRFSAWLGSRSRVREGARAGQAARCCHARCRGRIRSGVGQCLHLRVPTH